MAYQQLPVSDLPTVDFPTIQVSASLPGASPETLASAVALPLEKQFATIAGLNSINSTSSQGSTNITLQFDLSRNIDAAAQDVQAMIARAARQLPPQMPAPPSYQQGEPKRLQPVLFLVLRSATLPLSTINEYAESDDRAAHLDGQRRGAGAGVRSRRSTPCASTSIRGSCRRAASASTRSPPRSRTRTSRCRPGTMYGSQQTFTVLANGQLLRAQAYGPMIIAYRNGNAGAARRGRARLRRRRERQERGLVSAASGRSISPFRSSPGTNVVAVVDAVKALLPSLREQLPAAVSLDIRNDRSIAIRESVHDVKFTLMLTIVPGRARHLPVPAQPLGHDHPEPGAAGVDRRDLRGDVPARTTASTTCR